MRQIKVILLIQLSIMTLMFTGCCRRADDVWDDTKTASRHVGRGFRSLAGKHGDSRQVRCREDFMQCEEEDFCGRYSAMEFESFPDQDFGDEVVMAEPRFHPARARDEPGQGGHLPGIEGFKDSENMGELKEIFRTIHFPYNSSLVKGEGNGDTVRAIANYMKNNPDVYLFVEGHCDERGAEAYNLALGSRRSNSVRNLLIREGVSPENIFNVSYGKERPMDFGHTENSWAKNRRAEFRIYNARG